MKYLKIDSVEFILFVLLCLVTLVHIGYYYPRLPEIVASHFDATGKANGYSSKQVFMGLYAGLIGLMVFCFVGLPALLPKIPHSLINMPNKDYWFAPERRDETFKVLSHDLLRMGNATMALVVVLFHMVIQSSLTSHAAKPPQLSLWFWAILAAYLFYILIWTIVFYRKFRKPNC